MGKGRNRPGSSSVPGAQHDALEQPELPVEEVPTAGDDDDGQRLRACPGERCRERHDVVEFAVDNERVVGHRRQRLFLRRRPDQDQPFGRRSEGSRAAAAEAT